jgi:hypothetical protein
LGVSGQHGLHCKTLAKKKHQEQKQLWLTKDHKDFSPTFSFLTNVLYI